MLDRFRRRLGYQMPRLGPLAYRLFQRWGPSTLRTQLFPRIYATLDLRDQTQLATFWQGRRFEYPTVPVLKAWLHDASTFFDIGSNYGFFSFLALSDRPDLQVHAFEPHPRTFALLEKIKTENHLEHLVCWNCGLGHRNETLELHSGNEDLGHSTFGAHPDLGAGRHFSVPIRTFGDWRREQGISLPPRPEWVAKIDVEGFELRVLEGMREELLARAFRGLVIEANAYTLAFCGTSPEALERFLREVGYERIAASQVDPCLPAECGNHFFRPFPLAD